MSQFHAGGALAGLMFVAVGALFLADEAGAVALRPQVILPSILIGLGVVAIVGALMRRDRA